MTSSADCTESSGNVFADPGLSEPDEARAKSELALEISRLITRRALTQAKTAELLGINQPKVSALMRGNLVGFSLTRLLRYVAALGSDVQIVVQPAGVDSERGHLSVVVP